MQRLRYKHYVLATLTLVHTCNFLDRGLIGLLLQPIKEDLRLSDTQLGFVTGIAFALFYATLGVPIARLADRRNRVTITSIAIGLWSVTVMLCMFVTNFVQLVVARIAAAIGEAGCMPPTYSLVGDYFPGAAERARAMAVYTLASSLASLISMIAGGWLNERIGWRMTFFVMGMPALVLAVLVKLSIAEPRVHTPRRQSSGEGLPSIRHVLAAIWQQPSYRHLIIAFILLFTMGTGLAPWYAAFMMRSHGMGTAELGAWLGAIFCAGGIVGVLLGGYVVGRWFADNERGQMRLCAIMIAAVFPFFVLFLLLPAKHQALAALLPLVIVCGFFAGPTYALLQRLVGDDMRATAMSIVLLLANLIGMGVGPQLVGILSDVFQPSLGSDSLRYAMMSVCLVAFWAAFHFWKVGETVKEDLLTVARGGPSSDFGEARVASVS